MGRGATKVAVSIPDDLYQAIEKIRKIRRASRSAVVQDALRHWLHQQAQSARVREYEAGYRRRPESRREVKAAEAKPTETKPDPAPAEPAAEPKTGETA